MGSPWVVCACGGGGSTLHSLIALNMEDAFLITRTRTNIENKDYGLGSTELKSIEIIFLISTKRSFIVAPRVCDDLFSRRGPKQ